MANAKRLIPRALSANIGKTVNVLMMGWPVMRENIRKATNA